MISSAVNKSIVFWQIWSNLTLKHRDIGSICLSSPTVMQSEAGILGQLNPRFEIIELNLIGSACPIKDWSVHIRRSLIWCCEWSLFCSVALCQWWYSSSNGFEIFSPVSGLFWSWLLRPDRKSGPHYPDYGPNHQGPRSRQPCFWARIIQMALNGFVFVLSRSKAWIPTGQSSTDFFTLYEAIINSQSHGRFKNAC